MEQLIGGCVFVSTDHFQEALANNPSHGNRILEPFESIRARTGLPGFLVETCDILSEAEIHEGFGDLWLCFEGNPVFIVGGELLDGKQRQNPDGSALAGEFFSTQIAGGEEIQMRDGDLLWVPPGIPHQRRADGVSRYYLVKVPIVR